MHDDETRPDERGAPTRRSALARLGVGAGVAWTMPMVLAAPAGAQEASPPPPPPECPPGFVNKLFNVKIQPVTEDADEDEVLFEGSGYTVVMNAEIGGGAGKCVGNAVDDEEITLPVDKPRASRMELEAFAAGLAVDIDLDDDDEWESLIVYLPADCDPASLIAFQKAGPDCVRSEPGDVDPGLRSVTFPNKGKAISHVEIVVCCCVWETPDDEEVEEVEEADGETTTESTETTEPETSETTETTEPESTAPEPETTETTVAETTVPTTETTEPDDDE